MFNHCLDPERKQQSSDTGSSCGDASSKRAFLLEPLREDRCTRCKEEVKSYTNECTLREIEMLDLRSERSRYESCRLENNAYEHRHLCTPSSDGNRDERRED